MVLKKKRRKRGSVGVFSYDSSSLQWLVFKMHL